MSRTETQGMTAYADAILSNCDDGQFPNKVLQVFQTVCYANFTYFIPCATHTGGPQMFSLEWYGHVMGTRINTKDFEQMLKDHESDWLHGTSYGTAVLYFPHAVQALLPMLNIPLLGDTLERFVINHFNPDPAGARNWQQHYEFFHKTRWLKELSECLMECLGVTSKRGDEAFYHNYNAIGTPNPLFPPRQAPRLLCFDKLILPNNQINCYRHFVSTRRQVQLWSVFRQHVFNRFNVGRPQKAPLRIGMVRRGRDRRIINHDAVVKAILSKTGIPVTTVEYDGSMGLDIQVHSVASFHIFISPHGATLMNALFVQPGAVVIEVYPRNLTMGCYYHDILENNGIPYLKFCGIGGPCPETDELSPYGQYHRDDFTVDAGALSNMVMEVVNYLRFSQRPSSSPGLNVIKWKHFVNQFQPRL